MNKNVLVKLGLGVVSIVVFVVAFAFAMSNTKAESWMPGVEEDVYMTQILKDNIDNLPNMTQEEIDEIFLSEEYDMQLNTLMQNVAANYKKNTRGMENFDEAFDKAFDSAYDRLRKMFPNQIEDKDTCEWYQSAKESIRNSVKAYFEEGNQEKIKEIIACMSATTGLPESGIKIVLDFLMNSLAKMLNIEVPTASPSPTPAP